MANDARLGLNNGERHYELPNKNQLADEAGLVYEELVSVQLHDQNTPTLSLNVATILPQLAALAPTQENLDAAMVNFKTQRYQTQYGGFVSDREYEIMHQNFALAAKEGGEFADLAYQTVEAISPTNTYYRASLLIELASGGDPRTAADATEAIVDCEELDPEHKLYLLHRLDKLGFSEVSTHVEEIADQMYADTFDSLKVAEAVLNYGAVHAANERTYVDIADNFIYALDPREILGEGDTLSGELPYVSVMAAIYRAVQGDLYRDRVIDFIQSMPAIEQSDRINKMQAFARTADLDNIACQNIILLGANKVSDEKTFALAAEGHARRGDFKQALNGIHAIHSSVQPHETYQKIIQLGGGSLIFSDIVKSYNQHGYDDKKLMQNTATLLEKKLVGEAYELAKWISEPVLRVSALTALAKALRTPRPTISHLY